MFKHSKKGRASDRTAFVRSAAGELMAESPVSPFAPAPSPRVARKNRNTPRGAVVDQNLEALESRRLMSAAVNSLTLVNADTGQSIATLKQNSVLNLAALPTRHLNIVANATGDTQSVKFGYDNSGVHLDTTTPYVLVGDATAGTYRAWTPALGSHTVTATAYATDHPTRNTTGSTTSINFTVIDNVGRTGRATTGATATPANWRHRHNHWQGGSSSGTTSTTGTSNTSTGSGSTTTQSGSSNTTTGTTNTSTGTTNTGTTNTGTTNTGTTNTGTTNTGTTNTGNTNTGTTNTGTTNTGTTNTGSTNTGTSPTGSGSTTDPGSTYSPSPVQAGNPTPNAPVSGTWNLKFDDEFNGSSASNNWNYTIWGMTDSSGWDESESYSPNAVTEANGTLSLTASKQSRNGYPYTSGLVTTSNSFSFKYGYIEASMKLPAGQGLWPAFWMLPTPVNGNYHDSDGEIDIMEMVGNEPSTDYVHLHHVTTVGKGVTGTDLTTGYHTYGLDWEPDHITWFLDGKAIYTVTANVPSVPEYVILNLATGTSTDWPGAPSSSTQFPATMSVDYVRVWQTS